MRSHKSQIAGLRHGTRNHPAQILALVATAVDRAKIGSMFDPRNITESRLRIFLRQLVESIRITERATQDDIKSSLNELLGRWLYSRGIVGDIFDIRYCQLQRRFHLHARFVDRLLPPAVVFAVKVEEGHLWRRVERKTIVGTRAAGQHQPETGDKHKYQLHVPSPLFLWRAHRVPGFRTPAQANAIAPCRAPGPDDRLVTRRRFVPRPKRPTSPPPKRAQKDCTVVAPQLYGAPPSQRAPARSPAVPFSAHCANKVALSTTNPKCSEMIFSAASSISGFVPRTRSRGTTTRYPRLLASNALLSTQQSVNPPSRTTARRSRFRSKKSRSVG